MILLAPTLPILLTAQRGCARKNACHRVVIGLSNRIKLVIVTACTTQRESHRGAAKCIHLVIDAVKLELLAVAFIQIHRS